MDGRDFQNCPPLKISTHFYMIIIGDFEHYNALTLKQMFWKAITFFWKSEVSFFSLAFPRKLHCQKQMLRQIEIYKIRITKWTYHRQHCFATNYFVENLISISKPTGNSWFNEPSIQMSKFLFFLSIWALLVGLFSLWLSLSKKLHKFKVM